MTFAGVVNADSFDVGQKLTHGSKSVDTIPPSPFGRGKGEGLDNWKDAPSPQSSPRGRGSKKEDVATASVSWPDRFERFTNQASGSVPEVDDLTERTLLDALG